MARLLWAKRWLLFGSLIAGGVLGVAASYLVSMQFRATSRFIVEAKGRIRVPEGLQGLAAELGVAGGTASQSPDFYAALATQPSVAMGILLDTFTVRSAGEVRTARLVDFLRLDSTGLDSAELREEAVKKYVARLQTRVASRTGIVEIRFDAPSPDLAAAVANRLTNRIAGYDLQIRQTSASNARRFLDEQVAQAEDVMNAAQTDLRQFLDNNRTFANSPSLNLEFDRLERRARRLENLYEQLLLQRDRARIDEVSSVPALSVVDAAVPPFRKVRPVRRLWGAVTGLFLCAVVATSLVCVAIGQSVDPTVSRARAFRVGVSHALGRLAAAF